MVAHLPIDDSQFLWTAKVRTVKVRTAKLRIAEQGDAAVAAVASVGAIGAIGAVDQRISICKFEGLDSAAKTWRLIREVIRDMQESDAKERHA